MMTIEDLAASGDGWTRHDVDYPMAFRDSRHHVAGDRSVSAWSFAATMVDGRNP
jgi:hypothetical protein